MGTSAKNSSVWPAAIMVRVSRLSRLASDQVLPDTRLEVDAEGERKKVAGALSRALSKVVALLRMRCWWTSLVVVLLVSKVSEGLKKGKRRRLRSLRSLIRSNLGDV